MTDAELLARINQLCRRYAHCGVNMQTHALASKIAKLIEEHEREKGEGR
jgi:hypothetical protein